jgi:hypothetical protein
MAAPEELNRTIIASVIEVLARSAEWRKSEKTLKAAFEELCLEDMWRDATSAAARVKGSSSQEQLQMHAHQGPHEIAGGSMTLLAAYDRARTAIAEAKTVKATLAIRDQLDHVRLHAKQVQDRELLADATELQLRTERHLGALLAAAEKAGELRPRADRVQPKSGRQP